LTDKDTMLYFGFVILLFQKIENDSMRIENKIAFQLTASTIQTETCSVITWSVCGSENVAASR